MAEQRMWLYAHIHVHLCTLQMVGGSILINAHCILISAHSVNYAFSPFRENVTDGFYTEGDSGVALRKSLRRSLCHVHAVEERIQFIGKYISTHSHATHTYGYTCRSYVPCSCIHALLIFTNVYVVFVQVGPALYTCIHLFSTM